MRSYYEKAARLDNIRALGKLSRLYQYDLDVKKDDVKSREYSERAYQLQLRTDQIKVQKPEQQLQPLAQQVQLEEPQQPLIQVQQPQQNVPVVFPKDNFENFALKMRCSICKDNSVNMVINECGHLICSTCFNSLPIPKRCPKCKTEPITVRRIFYGGYKQKYLKYKEKYLKLKNKIL